MEPPASISCSGNCLVHLHSAAGKAWLDRHGCALMQHVGPDGIPRFLAVTSNNERKFLTAHEIRTLLFLTIKADFERFYGFPVQNVVAIIPACNNPHQYLSEISAAAEAAGASIVFSIERSVVCASYYDSTSTGRITTILVFELGGQFLEFSLITKDQRINMRAVVSDMGCPLFNLVVSELRSRIGNRITSDANCLYEILAECERGKDALCLGLGNVELKFNLLGMETRIPINREMLVRMNLDHVRCGITRCLTEAGVRREAVDEVILAGASCNIPAILGVLQEFFQRQPFRCNIDPANLIEVSSKQCMDIVSNTLNIPVVGFMGLNLGLYAL